MATAVAISECSIIRLEKPAMIKVLHDEPAFSELFITYLLARNVRIEEDLVDHLFNSSEKRLARLLLLLAQFGKEVSRITLSDEVESTVFDGPQFRFPTAAGGTGSGKRLTTPTVVCPATPEPAAVLAAVKDEPFGWPPAGGHP